MGRLLRLSPMALLGLTLAACTAGGGGNTPSSPTSSAHAGFGGPATTSPAVQVREVGEAIFQTPSKNIICSLTDSAVRCDIVRKTWAPPSKPADCELDWGNGMYIEKGKAGLTCAGDTLIGSAKETLDYGKALRSGTVVCESLSSGLTCKDTETGRGFTLAVARYSIF